MFTIFLLLLVILSVYSESPEHGKPPNPLDFTVVAVCPNSSSDPLGVLAPVFPQSEMFGTVLPQNEVFGSVLQNGVFKFVLPTHLLGGAGIHTLSITASDVQGLASSHGLSWALLGQARPGPGDGLRWLLTQPETFESCKLSAQATASVIIIFWQRKSTIWNPVDLISTSRVLIVLIFSFLIIFSCSRRQLINASWRPMNYPSGQLSKYLLILKYHFTLVSEVCIWQLLGQP